LKPSFLSGDNKEWVPEVWLESLPHQPFYLLFVVILPFQAPLIFPLQWFDLMEYYQKCPLQAVLNLIDRKSGKYLEEVYKLGLYFLFII
jgi:hypothetical protein